MQESGMLNYVQFPDLVGDSTDAQHVGWADILSYRFGVASTGDPRHAHQNMTVNFDALAFQLKCDALFPELIKICGEVRRLPEVVLEVTSGGAVPVVLHRFTLTNTLVRSVNCDGEAEPSMDVTTEYDKIRIESRKADGTYVITTYNCLTRRFE
jgi:type VI protein secretion system component Hcp